MINYLNTFNKLKSSIKFSLFVGCYDIKNFLKKLTVAHIECALCIDAFLELYLFLEECKHEYIKFIFKEWVMGTYSIYVGIWTLPTIK